MQAEDALAQPDVTLVAPALGAVAVERVVLRLGRVDRVICRGGQERVIASSVNLGRIDKSSLFNE